MTSVAQLVAHKQETPAPALKLGQDAPRDAPRTVGCGASALTWLDYFLNKKMCATGPTRGAPVAHRRKFAYK